MDQLIKRIQGRRPSDRVYLESENSMMSMVELCTVGDLQALIREHKEKERGILTGLRMCPLCQEAKDIQVVESEKYKPEVVCNNCGIAMQGEDVQDAITRWNTRVRRSRKAVEGVCGLCGHPMPEGEEMFNYHGYSGPCPDPTTPEDKKE